MKPRSFIPDFFSYITYKHCEGVWNGYRLAGEFFYLSLFIFLDFFCFWSVDFMWFYCSIFASFLALIPESLTSLLSSGFQRRLIHLFISFYAFIYLPPFFFSLPWCFLCQNFVPILGFFLKRRAKEALSSTWEAFIFLGATPRRL